MKLVSSENRTLPLRLGLLMGLIVGVLFLLYPSLEVAKFTLVVGGMVLLLGNFSLALAVVPLALPFLPNLAFTLLVGLVLASLVVRLALDREITLELPTNPLFYGFAILLVISGITSVTLGYSLREVLLHLMGWGLVVALKSGLHRRSLVQNFLLFLAVGSFLVSLYGIYGYVMGVEGESGWVDAAMHPDMATRAFSTFGNPNVLAEYLVFTIPFTWALAWYHRAWTARAVYGGMGLVQLLCLVLTMSRSGWIAFAFGMAIFAFLVDKRLLWLGVIGGIAALPVLANSQVFLRRLLSIFSLQDSSNAHRIVVWRETLTMIQEYWATGVGLGHRAFRVVYPYFAFDRTKFPFHSHNTYLQVAVETGLFGLTAFLLYMGSLLKQSFQGAWGSRTGFDRCVLGACAASLGGAMAFGFFESILYLPKIIILFWLVVGLTTAVWSLGHQEQQLVEPVKGLE